MNKVIQLIGQIRHNKHVHFCKDDQSKYYHYCYVSDSHSPWNKILHGIKIADFCIIRTYELFPSRFKKMYVCKYCVSEAVKHIEWNIWKWLKLYSRKNLYLPDDVIMEIVKLW